MASPFRVFRKYQKTMLAIAGVVCMFVFVIGDSLFNYFGGSRTARATNDRDAGAVAVRWDGGKLTNRELNDLVRRRKIVNYFLKEVEATGRPPSEDPSAPPSFRVENLLGPETPQEHVEQDVVRNKIFAEAAREAGMKVSDETVVQYLVDWGHGNVSTQKMRQMLQGRSEVTIDHVIDAIREAMLARHYLLSHQYAFGTVTPQQRWKDWLEVKDFVVLEAAAVPAESFLVDVKDPTEAELTAFFEQYKDREAQLDFPDGVTELPSATPGFRIRRKIGLQFVQANYEELLAKEEPKITDQEIAKHYDEHKDQFEKAQLGLSEDKGAKKETTKPETPAANKPLQPKPAEEPKQSTAPEANKAQPEAKKGAGPESKKGSAPAAEDKKSSDAPATKDGKNESTTNDSKKSSSVPQRVKSVFRLTALEKKADDKDPKADKTTPADEAAKSDAKSEGKSAEPAKSRTTPPPSSAGAAKAPGPALQSAGAATSSQPAGAAPAAPKKPVEYQPLSEVKDVIRRQLAEMKVSDELGKTLDAIWKDIDDPYEKWVGDALAAESNKQERPAPPKSLTDLAPIAQKYGWKQGHTGPASLLELRNMPVGKTLLEDADTSLLQVLFLGRDLELYQPVKVRNPETKDRFVAMKVSDTPGRVPELAEVRGEVIQAWKKQKAADLAKKRAEELAKKAQDAKATLTNFFADDKAIKVVRTDPFSHLTGGDVSVIGGQLQQQPFRLSQPSEIVAPGPEFLSRAFELKDGEVGVAMNNDHSIAYVVRVVEHQPSLAELRNEYLTESMTWLGESATLRKHTNEAAGILESGLEAEAKVKWERDPDRVKQDMEHGES